jgi:hypothetical protein
MRKLRRRPSHNYKQGNQHRADDNALPSRRLLLAELSPVAAGVHDVVLERFGAELVVHETAERNAVPKELGCGNGGAPDEDGGCDEKNVLQDAAEGEDEGGGFADLVEKRALAGGCV